jgi:hypothetical protein
MQLGCRNLASEALRENIRNPRRGDQRYAIVSTPVGNVHPATRTHLHELFASQRAIRGVNDPVVHVEFRSELPAARQAISLNHRAGLKAPEYAAPKGFDDFLQPICQGVRGEEVKTSVK